MKDEEKEKLMTALKKAAVGHLSFEAFKRVCMVAVFFSEKLSLADIEEILNDWYVLYKEMYYQQPIDFLKFHLPPGEVNRSSHDFWLDERGLLLLYLQTRVY